MRSIHQSILIHLKHRKKNSVRES